MCDCISYIWKVTEKFFIFKTAAMCDQDWDCGIWEEEFNPVPSRDGWISVHFISCSHGFHKPPRSVSRIDVHALECIGAREQEVHLSFPSSET